MNKKFLTLGLVASLFFSSSVFADTIIKFDLGSTGPDVEYVGGVFSTVDDGVVGTIGEQDSGIDFTGFLDGAIADILVGASITIDNVIASGAANIVGPIIAQETTGGTISLWDNVGGLLLTGTLGSGAITGSQGGETGSFFNTTVMTYTAGSLLSFVSPTPAGISIALNGILSGGLVGMNVAFNPNTNAFELQNFTSDASGLLTGSAVPEPASMLLLGSAIFGGIASRRKKAA